MTRRVCAITAAESFVKPFTNRTYSTSNVNFWKEWECAYNILKEINMEQQGQAVQDLSFDEERDNCKSGKCVFWKYARVIAVVCVALAGLFFAWLHMDIHKHESLEEINGVYFPEIGFEALDVMDGYPFSFAVRRDIPMQWEISVNAGGFHDGNMDIALDGTWLKREDMGYLGKEFTIENCHTVYWSQFEYDSGHFEEAERIYIEAILYAESHIVGYCVIEIHCVGEGGANAAEILGSAYYPPRNGAYQHINMAHVRSQILKAKIRENLSSLV